MFDTLLLVILSIGSFYSFFQFLNPLTIKQTKNNNSCAATTANTNVKNNNNKKSVKEEETAASNSTVLIEMGNVKSKLKKSKKESTAKEEQETTTNVSSSSEVVNKNEEVKKEVKVEEVNVVEEVKKEEEVEKKPVVEEVKKEEVKKEEQTNLVVVEEQEKKVEEPKVTEPVVVVQQEEQKEEEVKEQPKVEETIVQKEEEVQEEQEQPKEETIQETTQEEEKVEVKEDVAVVVESTTTTTNDDKKEEEEKKEESSNSFTPSSNLNTTTQSFLLKPSHIIKYIIGPKGSTIKAIQEETNSKIQVTDQDSETKLITIQPTNDEGSVEKVYTKLMETLKGFGWEYSKEEDQFIETGTEAMALFKELEKKIDSESKLMSKCFEEAKLAYEAGNGEEAKTKSEEGKKHQELMKQYQLESSQKMFEFLNKEKGLNEIDLHGQYLDNAMNYLKERIEKILNDSSIEKKELIIIYGAGIHSDQSKGPKIKPTVLSYLNEKNIKYEEETHGSILAHLA